MPTKTPTRLNLSIDKNFQAILQFYKKQSPLMSEVDIIRDVIGKSYVKDSLEFDQPTEKMSEKQSNGVGISKKQIKQGKFTTHKSGKDFIKSLKI